MGTIKTSSPVISPCFSNQQEATASNDSNSCGSAERRQSIILEDLSYIFDYSPIQQEQSISSRSGDQSLTDIGLLPDFCGDESLDYTKNSIRYGDELQHSTYNTGAPFFVTESKSMNNKYDDNNSNAIPTNNRTTVNPADPPRGSSTIELLHSQDQRESSHSINNTSVDTDTTSAAILDAKRKLAEHRQRQLQQRQQQQKQNMEPEATNRNNNIRIDDESDKQSSRGSDQEQVPSNPNYEITFVTGRRYMFREILDYSNQFRYSCGMFVNNSHVQLVVVILIAINAMMMGIGTFDFVTDNPEISDIFELVDLIFLIVFTVELGLQFIYHGWRLILDGWLLFDLVIIVTSWSFSSVQIIRAFRIFRALRLVTRIKIMKNLILALFGVMPRMAAIGLLLCLIFYIFAVMFTQLFKDLHKENKTDYDYFSRIDGTFFTLFQIMTLDNWADIARQVIKEYKWAWFPFIIFVIISGFIVVNLIIAVICDAISALHKDEKAKIHGNFEGDGASDNSDATPELEIREQLDCLEEQMEELTRVQAKTFHTLQYLTRQLQMHKLKQELKTKQS